MSRGRLRLYLGAAPGVGKTYAMLNEGWRRKERGTDVVVGFMEDHGRANTRAQRRDLEVVPRRKLTYRDVAFEEMDVDAVLARRPQVALVDELAHTNVPGSRNEKRWQDVEELLDAGIDVVSTLNIQHLESLNDVVEGITGIHQRERIPDDVVRRAEQIELVDMTPEALRRRMAHGNVYAPDKINAALGNYFRPGNLTALRELALMWVADRVDEALQDYRARHGIERPWETRERVVVALTGAPWGAALIRRAARMAARLRAELVGVHVRSQDGLAGPGDEGLQNQRQLLVQLGGQYVEAVGGDVPRALVQVARAENATQLVLGASQRSRWAELTQGSIINGVMREAAGTLDIHVISHEALTGTRGGSGASRGPLGRRHLGRLPRRRVAIGALLGLAGVPLLTVVLTRLRDQVELPAVLMLYLLLVVVVSAVGGSVPAAAVALSSFLIVNWYFTPPLHTWTIAQPENMLALVVFMVVAGVVSNYVALAARRSAEASRARAEAETLARLAAVSAGDDPLAALLSHIRELFRLEATAVLSRHDDGWKVEAAAGEPVPPRPEDAHASLALGPDAALVLQGEGLVADDQQVLGACAAQLESALESRRLSGEASRAAALAQADELRTALLAAVSHDLRTPLASIKASVSSLRQADVTWSVEAREEFLATIEEETDRLNRLVGNLLDMSRLQAGAVEVLTREIGLEEVVPAALAELADGAAVKLEVPETLPRVRADPALLERAVANLIANAVSWSPVDHPVRVEAGAVAGRVDLRVVDRGPGISPADRERVFQPFQRLGDGARAATPGVGLGLAVARGFVEAMGGELTLEDTPGGGLTAVISLRSAEGSAER